MKTERDHDRHLYTNDDERSSRKPGVYAARAEQVALNKSEWAHRADAAAARQDFETQQYIEDTQISDRHVVYLNGHLQIA